MISHKTVYTLFQSDITSIDQPVQGSYPFSETYFKDFSKTFPGLKFVFPELQISPKSLSFPRFQTQLFLWYVYISYNVNSENYLLS